MELHQIENAVRKQIVTTKNPRCRLETDPVFNLGSKGVGKMVFIGLAFMYGFKKEDILEYLDVGPDEIDTKLSKFNKYMQIAADRPADKSVSGKVDMICHTYRKAQFAISYIRLNFLRQSRFSYASISY